MAGDGEACRRLLGEAVDLFEQRRPDDEPPYARDYSASFLRLQAADYDLSLGRVGPALCTLRRELPALPPSRHRAYSTARLAHGYVSEQDATAAAGAALEALPMARRTGAVRAVRELRRLRDRLAPARHRPAVGELYDALSTH
jgi:hypothetical protein